VKRIALLQATSSHAEAFAAILNDPAGPVAGRATVTALWDADINRARAAAAGAVPATDDLDAALDGADGVMICGRWGDEHPEIAIEAARRKLPAFIDKPLAANAGDAARVADAFAEVAVPAMSASAYRFAPEVLALRERLDDFGDWRSGHAAGISEWPDFGAKGRELHFYGVHVAEMIQAVFGGGMTEVSVRTGPDSDIATLAWPDGRLLDWHLLRNAADIYEVRYYGADGTGQATIDPDGAYYENMMDAFVTMLETGISPVPLSDSVEIVRLLDAVTHARGTPGKSVSMTGNMP
jgi:predicted dehydrogenase